MRYFAVLLALLMGLGFNSAPGQAKQNKYLIQKNINSKQNYQLTDDKPILRWTAIPDTKSSTYRIFSTKEVYSNAYQADLSQYQENIVYWRVKPLNYHGDPISVYSDAKPLEIGHRKQKTLKPSRCCF